MGKWLMPELIGDAERMNFCIAGQEAGSQKKQVIL